ncbi:PIN domain-containing protein [Ammoniphilus sp. 3BR4]|uniref:PIN domain-containing protein n=1 Tax=Ammoniphilus sp. 3BR4 TaxID=3158265 RepID=UPI003465E248
MKEILDTNIIIRFLANDHPEHSPRARILFEKMTNNELSFILDSIVIAECVYVLSGKYYGYSRSDIAEWLTKVIEHCEVDNKDVLLQALSNYSRYNTDFADAYLASLAEHTGTMVATFNRKDFNKMGINSLEL